MAIIRNKDLRAMDDKEKKEKLKELKLELTRANVTANKTGKIKIKEIKRTIARLIMFMAVKGQKNK
jgi:ribosomal protein L29